MKRIYYLGAIALSLVVVGCNVDDDYDLGDAADNTEFGIGTDESSFDLALADINLSLSQITSGGGDQMRAAAVASTSMFDVLEVVDDLSAILPSDLSGTAYDGGVDLNKLGDREYTSGLIALLFDELAVSAEKRVDLVTLVFEKIGLKESDVPVGGDVEIDADYQDIVATLESVLGAKLNTFSNISSCAAAVDVALNSADSAQQTLVEKLKDDTTDLIVEKSGEIETEYTVQETIGEALEIPDDVVRLLKKNLDGKKNTLSIHSKITTNLPLGVKLRLDIILSTGERISVSEFVEALEQVERDESISEEQLDDLLQGLAIDAVIEANGYDPSLGDLDMESMFVKLTLIARKRGSLKF